MDSTTPYWPEGLDVPLIGRRLQVDPRNRGTVMESNRVRLRREYVEVLKTMEVSWNFTKDQYSTFRTFFIEELKHGSLAFVLITLEPDTDLSKLRQYTREVAFLDGKYSFAGSDNLYSVSAVLEIDAEDYVVVKNPLYVPPTGWPSSNPVNPVSFTSTCRETVCFTWDLSPDFDTRQDVIQCSLHSSGLDWYDYIVAVPTQEQLNTGKMTVLVNNDFKGERWFRLLRGTEKTYYPNGSFLYLGGKTIWGPVCPQASAVAAPENVEVASTYVSTRPVFTSGPFIRPISRIENPLITDSEVYVEPTQRLEIYMGVNYDGGANTLKYDIPDSDAVGRWTRDGSDPQADMAWPPAWGHYYENEEDIDAVCWGAGFGLAIKMRCFTDTCRSPMRLILVDVLKDEYQYIGIITEYYQNGHSCRYESGSAVSCDVLFGSASAMESYLDGQRKNCIIQTNVPEDVADSYLFGHRRFYIWRKEKTAYDTAIDRYCNYAKLFTISAIGGATGNPIWETLPLAFESIQASAGAEFFNSEVARPGDGGRHATGIGGTVAAHARMLIKFLWGLNPSFSGEPYNGSLLLDTFDVRISLYDDRSLEVTGVTVSELPLPGPLDNPPQSEDAVSCEVGLAEGALQYVVEAQEDMGLGEGRYLPRNDAELQSLASMAVSFVEGQSLEPLRYLDGIQSDHGQVGMGFASGTLFTVVCVDATTHVDTGNVSVGFASGELV